MFSDAGVFTFMRVMKSTIIKSFQDLAALEPEKASTSQSGTLTKAHLEFGALLTESDEEPFIASANSIFEAAAAHEAGLNEF
ncbi:MAG TPA: hypothetical protein VGE41_02240 [Verrucomicrobiae bacterium]|jgi:hypothetical protein